MTLPDEVKEVLAATVGGATYGVKIRMPHALIMTALFRRKLTISQKVHLILQLTMNHAKRLATYAAGYKIGLLVLKWLARVHRKELKNMFLKNGGQETTTFGDKLVSLFLHGTTSPDPKLPRALAAPGFPEQKHHALLAGMVSGYFAWGDFNALNYQVLLYVASRSFVGLWKRVHEGLRPSDDSSSTGAITTSSWVDHPVSYRILSGLVWGLAMILFEESPHVLHASMRKSMDEIYRFRLFEQS